MIRHENPRVISVQNTHGARKKLHGSKKILHGDTDRKLKINGRKSPCGADGVYLPSLVPVPTEGLNTVPPVGLMECVYSPCGATGVYFYRPCGDNGVYSLSLWGHWSVVFTVHAGIMECIYRPCGAN